MNGHVSAGKPTCAQIETARVDHLAQHGPGLVEAVVAHEHLPVRDETGGWAVFLYLPNRAWLLPPGMVEEVLAVFTQLFSEPFGARCADPSHVENPLLRQPVRDAWAHLPYVGYRVVEPYLAFVGLLVEDPDAVGGLLGLDVEGHLSQEQVGSYPGRGRDACFLHHLPPEERCELPCAHAVELEVWGGVDEALVDGVDVHVLWG